jgi:hypothetical protein
MKILKLKIFDVLTEKIKISEFEKWMYTSEVFMSQVESSALYFDVININYRNENALDSLLKITPGIFSEDDLLLVKLVDNCIKIVNAENTKSFKKYVFNIINEFNFEHDLHVFWEFYNIYYSFDGYDYCEFQNIDFAARDAETKILATSIVSALEKTNSIEEKILWLKQKPASKKTISPAIIASKTIEKTKKLTVKQKIFAFFKKI